MLKTQAPPRISHRGNLDFCENSLYEKVCFVFCFVGPCLGMCFFKKVQSLRSTAKDLCGRIGENETKQSRLRSQSEGASIQCGCVEKGRFRHPYGDRRQGDVEEEDRDRFPQLQDPWGLQSRTGLRSAQAGRQGRHDASLQRRGSWSVSVCGG